MGKCRWELNNSGEIIGAKTKNGQESKLFKNLASKFGLNKAVELFAVSESENFKELLPNNKVTTKLVSEYMKSKLGQAINILSESEMLAELKKRGFGSLRGMVEAWHGTTRPIRNLKLKSPVGERYGDALDGTYYGDLVVARVFAGISPQKDRLQSSKLFKAEIDEKGFTTIDFQGKTPSNDEQLAKIIGWDKLDDIIEGKKSGQIKGLILKNTYEPYLGAKSTTQYVVYDNNYVNQIDKLSGGKLDAFLEGVQFSAKPLGTEDKVYGFYDQQSKEIFLTEEFLSSESAIHEMWHATKPAIENSAKKDKTAELLLKTMDKLVDESGMFNEQETIDRYNQSVKNGLGVNAMIVGNEELLEYLQNNNIIEKVDC
jgi:hypothetical protein